MSDRVLLAPAAPFPGLAPDKAQALKPLEEAAEVYAAWQLWDDVRGTPDACGYGLALRHLMGEIADCVQACCNLAASLGCRDLGPHMEACEARNRERGRYD